MQPHVQRRFEKQTMPLIGTISSNDNPFENQNRKSYNIVTKENSYRRCGM